MNEKNAGPRIRRDEEHARMLLGYPSLTDVRHALVKSAQTIDPDASPALWGITVALMGVCQSLGQIRDDQTLCATRLSELLREQNQ